MYAPRSTNVNNTPHVLYQCWSAKARDGGRVSAATRSTCAVPPSTCDRDCGYVSSSRSGQVLCVCFPCPDGLSAGLGRGAGCPPALLPSQRRRSTRLFSLPEVEQCPKILLRASFCRSSIQENDLLIKVTASQPCALLCHILAARVAPLSSFLSLYFLKVHS